MSYFRPRYYTSALIADLKSYANQYAEQEWFLSVADGYRKAEKFLLPDNGLLFDDTNLTRYVDLFRLPFPMIVLEYAGFTGHYALKEAQRGEEVDTCLLASEIPATVEGARPEGVMVWVAYTKPGQRWMLIPTVLEVPYGMNASQMEGQEFKFRKSVKKGVTDKEAENYAHIILKECLSLFQFCAAVACGNVRSEETKAPKFINQQRIAKGKPPLFSYHVLTIDPTQRHDSGEAKGGTHASPRQHLRRGHIRRYASGLTLWINSTVVGSAKLGKVEKDYVVRQGVFNSNLKA